MMLLRLTNVRSAKLAVKGLLDFEKRCQLLWSCPSLEDDVECAVAAKQVSEV